jgi:hypothetical protein
MEYAIYLEGNGPTDVTLELPRGQYSCEWLNVKTGSIEQLEKFTHKGGEKLLSSPAFQSGIALRLRRTMTKGLR